MISVIISKNISIVSVSAIVDLATKPSQTCEPSNLMTPGQLIKIAVESE